MKKLTYFLTTLGILFLASCSSENSKNYREEAAPSKVVTPIEEASAYENNSEVLNHEVKISDQLLAEKGLPKELVCMVNNAYMGKKQYPVQHEGKQYYGCCQMCVNTIQSNRQVRVALDPLTGKEVDKSLAYIAPEPGSSNNGVLYFESRENYLKYMN